MVKFRSCILICIFALLCLAGGTAQIRKLYPDDPIQADPKPIPVGKIGKLKINAMYDYLSQSHRQKMRTPSPSLGVNTMDEVPDSAWFVNRHGRQRIAKQDLKRGAGNENVPQPPFTIVGAKSEGITPGFQMRDAKNRLYFVKPDPISSPELSTGADVVVSKFFHAIGYNTPENYIIKMRKSDWSIHKEARVTGIGGVPREMVAKDLYDILAKVPILPDGSFRLVASLTVPGKGIGAFRYEGTRSDDPNDIIPHEQRRDLRGLFVFCAWLNHTDTKGANSYDSVLQDGNNASVCHYLMDFGSALGSDGDIRKDARFGREYQIPSIFSILKKALSLGFWSQDWERASYPKLKAVGRIDARTFDPERWKPNYPNPAFLSRLPGDEYWAAKIVMSFSDDDIRALIETGEYSDSRVVDYLASTLAQRRDKIAKAYYSKVLPLEKFRVENGQLLFEDLSSKIGLKLARSYRITWSRFGNGSVANTLLPEESSFGLPREFAPAADGSYYVARIRAQDDERKNVSVYLRKHDDTADVAGIERAW
jgi:hypothetical protein